MKKKRTGTCHSGITYEYAADCFNGLWKVREWRTVLPVKSPDKTADTCGCE